MTTTEINGTMYLKLEVRSNACNAELANAPGKRVTCDMFESSKTCHELPCMRSVYLVDTPELRAELATAILEQ